MIDMQKISPPAVRFAFLSLFACCFVSTVLAQNVKRPRPGRQPMNGPLSATMPGGGELMNWTVNGERRMALVFASTSDMAVKRPPVFAFHGHGATHARRRACDAYP
jgi:hypothetical protein